MTFETLFTPVLRIITLGFITIFSLGRNPILAQDIPINKAETTRLSSIEEKTKNCIVQLKIELEVKDGSPKENEYQKSAVTSRIGIGFIISTDKEKSIAVISANLVKDAKNITVQLPNGLYIPGKLFAVDTRSNIGLIEIPSINFTPVQWGNSDGLAEKTWALAYSFQGAIDGAVDGLPHIVAIGIKGKYRYFPILLFNGNQRAGAIGSPIFNQKGEVIGMINAIKPTADKVSSAPLPGDTAPVKASNIAYALPGNLLKNLTAELKENKCVQYPWIGIAFSDTAPEGAWVHTVTENGPAHLAGLKINDIIYAFNADSISNGVDLAIAISKMKIGSKAEIALIRDGKKLKISVLVKPMPVSNGE